MRKHEERQRRLEEGRRDGGFRAEFEIKYSIGTPVRSIEAGRGEN